MYGDKNIIDETGGDPVSGALSNLERVQAPSNFEDSVMRLIRLSTREKPGASYVWLKIAVPTVALVLLAAFFGLSSLTMSEILQIQVAEERQVRDPLAPPGMDGAQDDLAGVQNGNSNRTARRAVTYNSQPQTDELPGGGVVDQGVRAADDPVLGKGFDRTKRPDQNGSEFGTKKTVRVVDILQFFGVRSEVRGGEFVVTSVVESSASARAGLQIGDGLLAINDVAITQAATVPAGNIQSIRIRRNGQTVMLRF